jgi:hypothetical protein
MSLYNQISASKGHNKKMNTNICKLIMPKALALPQNNKNTITINENLNFYSRMVQG